MQPQTAAAGRQGLGRHEEGAESARAVEVLAHRPLRRLELVVADRGVVEQRIGDDVVQSPGLGDVAPPAADDGDKLALVIELLGNAWADDGRAVADEARRKPAEDRRVGRHLETALGRVVGVVQSDADDLAGPRQGRQQLDRFQVDFATAQESLAGAPERSVVPREEIGQAPRVTILAAQIPPERTFADRGGQPFDAVASVRGKAHARPTPRFAFETDGMQR